MPIKKYGIYTSYHPSLDMQGEGLIRYLASFLKGASERNDIKFVLACPSWSKKDFLKFLKSEGVSLESFDIISPRGTPWLAKIYAWHFRKKRKPATRSAFIATLVKLIKFSKKTKKQIFEFLENRVISIFFIHNIWGGAMLPLNLILLASAFVLFSPVLVIAMLFYTLRFIVSSWRLLSSKILAQTKNSRLLSLAKKLIRVLREPMQLPFGGFLARLKSRLYSKIRDWEGNRILKLINKQKDVIAWYSPTAFWPEFNKIKAPRLLCVPDVVLTDFSMSFGLLTDASTAIAFKRISKIIRSEKNIVTYSNYVKWNTLVDYFGAEANSVSVVHHAPNTLDIWLKPHNSSTLKETTSFSPNCKALIFDAFKKSTNPTYTSSLFEHDFQFLFYASQLRPNKNIFSLLRAYEYLLRRSLISHKLIITGHPAHLSGVGEFINKHRLWNDVLSLPKLSVNELAACYHFADLAINPSLSEGGCPFTFSEALSVGTPVVMARIPVSEEVLADPQLQEMTFFDPYDWKDMAKRIEWALNNREALLEVQQKAYQLLSKRTWTDVVNEHITIMDRLAEKASQKEAVE
jgi:glycosyltransferase involved in cell wall biosynthesis